MGANDIETLNAEILAETEKLASSYAAKFEADPEAELRAWLHVAARREAMVSTVYGEAERSYRLPGPRSDAGDVAWEALTLIWQQEEVHTRFIEVKLIDGVLKGPPLGAELMIWLGTMEGNFLRALTRRPGLWQILAKLAVNLGVVFAPGKLPGFATALSELGLRDLFLLFAVLESTARQCYARMEVLADRLADKLAHDSHRSLQIENLVRELRLKTLDETFHERAFEEIAGWVVGDQLDRRMTARSCAQRLADLLPRGAKVAAGGGGAVVTDGGLGQLFTSRGLSVVVESAE
jgi:hypothetical protein